MAATRHADRAVTGTYPMAWWLFLAAFVTSTATAQDPGATEDPAGAEEAPNVVPNPPSTPPGDETPVDETDVTDSSDSPPAPEAPTANPPSGTSESPDVPPSEPSQIPAGEEVSSPDAGESTNEAETAAATPSSEPGLPPDEDGIYQGLDHTGTPPLPAREGGAPSGEWSASYDGRADPPPRAEDALVWVPRLVLFPVYLTLEYVVRKPVVAFISWAEENHIFERIGDLLTFADGKGFIFPSVFLVSGQGVQFGLNVTVDDVGPHEHNLAASAQYGTGGFYNVALSDEWSLFENDVGTLRLAGQFGEDPTWAFYGVGPQQPIDNEVFYGIRRGEVTTDLLIAFAELNRVRLHLGYRNVQLVGGQNPSIDGDESPFQAAVLNGEFFGFADPYNIFSLGLGFDLDTRAADRQYTEGTGVRLEAFGTYNFTIGDPDLNFFRYGIQPSLFIDFSGVNHVLELSVYADAISTTNGNTPPINELVTIGGPANMRAYLPGRSRGESALSASITYTWPVFFFLDGILLAEMGNAFNGFYEDFGFGRMLVDFGFGFRTSFSREGAIDILLRLGQQSDRAMGRTVRVGQLSVRARRSEPSVGGVDRGDDRE